VGEYLGNQERLVPALADGVLDDKLGIPIHLGRIDMVHAVIEAGLKP